MSQSRTDRTDGVLRFGEVCDGWSPASWAAYLRKRANDCAEMHQTLAVRYREWAKVIEDREQLEHRTADAD